MTEGPHHTNHAGIDVAIFDRGRLVTTRSCRGISEARSIISHVGRDGYDCLIVSPALRESLRRPQRVS